MICSDWIQDAFRCIYWFGRTASDLLDFFIWRFLFSQLLGHPRSEVGSVLFWFNILRSPNCESRTLTNVALVALRCAIFVVLGWPSIRHGDFDIPSLFGVHHVIPTFWCLDDWTVIVFAIRFWYILRHFDRLNVCFWYTGGLWWNLPGLLVNMTLWYLRKSMSGWWKNLAYASKQVKTLARFVGKTFHSFHQLVYHGSRLKWRKLGGRSSTFRQSQILWICLHPIQSPWHIPSIVIVDSGYISYIIYIKITSPILGPFRQDSWTVPRVSRKVAVNGFPRANPRADLSEESFPTFSPPKIWWNIVPSGKLT